MRFSSILRSAAAAILSGAAGARAADTVDFNRDIRPILSEKCFRCHGPDQNERKGGPEGLRLDVRADALQDLGGYHAIVPGQPEKSELVTRITTDDEAEVMPPPKTGKFLSPHEVALLRRWIAEGANYARHWSYEKPRRPEPPAVQNAAWPRGPLDRFILARLEAEKLAPQPEADRATLARRVALDLTGLPPEWDEVQAFVQDARPDAYERFVDAQLAKPAYGEHWARAWLDLARYADSKGYAEDQARSIWRYRDYVIDALNANMPFDQFTIEQLAGDLLPNPTEAQLFATGFHRNTLNNTEGGTDDEEFRSAAVVDRVNTTMAVWMGTSIACAQCHTHKYDPLTQKEYFQLYAIFNQTEDADKTDESPVLEFYTDAQKAQRAKWDAEIAALEAKLTAAKPAHLAAMEKWAREFPARIAWKFPRPAAAASAGGASVQAADDGSVRVEAAKEKDTLTLEVPVAEGVAVTALQLAVPARAGSNEGNFVVTRVRAGTQPIEPFRRARYVRVELPGKIRMLSLAEVEVFAGGENIAATGKPSQSTTDAGADAARAVDGKTDGEFAKNTIAQTETGEDPWWELDLGASRPLERVVIWGRTGAEATPAGLKLVLLDEARQPVWEQVSRAAPNPSRAFAVTDPREIRLPRAVADFSQPEFDEALIGVDNEPRAARRRSAAKKGWGVAGAVDAPHTLTLQPERPFTVKPGEKLVVTIEQQSEKPKGTLTQLRVGITSDAGVRENLRTPAAELAALQVPPGSRTAAQKDRLLDYYVRQIAPELATEQKRLATLRSSLEEMPVNTSPVMRELPAAKQRKTHVQLRGNFAALGEEVGPGVPAAFPALPAGATVNRLTLARWLVSEENPLTARVTANRLWEAIFGIGLVRTAEEFGSQGELPSHPELLDWLATEIVALKWDQKRFLKMLVTSAAYRQSAKVTPAALAADPENRLLSRGPRFRLPAETVRDQALAVSGLLSRKMHGPSARPFQPLSELKAAFGATLDWKPSEGEDRFRRGLYTEWRRSNPYPSMVTFDAPNREVCTLRRNRTNTPLQALVTLNDPVYVEAAQSLGRLLAAGTDASIEGRVRDGFVRVLLRAPTAAELAHMRQLYENARAAFAAAPDKAAALNANSALPPADAALAPTELAAWTTVANVLLNLDETLMKR